jgi:hypothetical protein
MNSPAGKSGFRKSLKYIAIVMIGLFALIGFFLTGAFFAIKFHLTDDPGAVDFNDRYFQEIKEKYGHPNLLKGSAITRDESEFYHEVMVLNKYYPENSFYIMNAYTKSHNLAEARRMMDAVNIYLQDNHEYQEDIRQFDYLQEKNRSRAHRGSIFEWMNIAEWPDFKLAVAKDKALIDSAAHLTGVEPRLIVSVLVGEQIRLFNSDREAYKKWIGPLKILSVETTLSLGVTGIKILTAQRIEQNLKDRSSVFYLGPKYEHLLDFETNSVDDERYKRLTSYKNHFYSYLYAALNIKQLKMQWERAGFPIDSRPEIIATLYNIGFDASVPKENPLVGGSDVMIHNQSHSFGAVSYEFYYSGELFDLFPFKTSKFDAPGV